MRKAKLAGALALAVIVGAIGVTAVLARDPSNRPREMLVAAHGLMVRTTSGSYCVDHDNVARVR